MNLDGLGPALVGCALGVVIVVGIVWLLIMDGSIFTR